jgi:hypothetical protein
LSKKEVIVMHRPSLGAVLCGLIPFVAICFSVSWWDRIYPMVFGLPFNLFWLIAWVVVTPFIMWGAYRLEMAKLAGRQQEGAKHE